MTSHHQALQLAADQVLTTIDQLDRATIILNQLLCNIRDMQYPTVTVPASTASKMLPTLLQGPTPKPHIATIPESD